MANSNAKQVTKKAQPKAQPKKAQPKAKSSSGLTFAETNMVALQKGLTVLPFKSNTVPREDLESVYTAPVNESADQLNLCEDSSAVITMTRDACSDGLTFCNGVMKVYALLYNLPVAFRSSTTKIEVDKRGSLVEMRSTGVKFKNISHEDVEVHANCPFGIYNTNDVFARLPGFKDSKGRLSDSVIIKPGHTAKFMSDWTRMPANYSPIKGGDDGTPDVVICNFAVRIRSTTFSTQQVSAEILSMKAFSRYVGRTDSLVNVATGEALSVVQRPHFNFNKLEGGEQALLGLDPISESTLAFLESPVDFIERATGPGSLINDLQAEGITHYGLLEINRLGNYSYPVVVLAGRTGSAAPRPVALVNRQSVLSRIVLPTTSMTIFGEYSATGPGQNKVTCNTFAWDSPNSCWVLWDDYHRKPYQSNYIGQTEGHVVIPVSLPIYYFTLSALSVSFDKQEDGSEKPFFSNLLTGQTYTEEEFNVERLRHLSSRDPRGVPYDSPRVDPRGVSLTDILGAIVIIGKIAAYALTVL